MKSKFIIIGLTMLLFVIGCKSEELVENGPNNINKETEKMEIAYTFLLKKLQKDSINLIASKDDENLSLIHNIIHTNRLNIGVENYNNLEQRQDLCYYSKSTKKAVAIIDITRRNKKKYYVSYYIGPEGGASKEILIEKKIGKWAIVNDDGMWNVK